MVSVAGHPLPVAAAKVIKGPSVCTAKWVPNINPSTTTYTVSGLSMTGAPLISQADQRRHYELFRGRSGDGGQTWALDDNAPSALACKKLLNASGVSDVAVAHEAESAFEIADNSINIHQNLNTAPIKWRRQK